MLDGDEVLGGISTLLKPPNPAPAPASASPTAHQHEPTALVARERQLRGDGAACTVWKSASFGLESRKSRVITPNPNLKSRREHEHELELKEATAMYPPAVPASASGGGGASSTSGGAASKPEPDGIFGGATSWRRGLWLRNANRQFNPFLTRPMAVLVLPAGSGDLSGGISWREFLEAYVGELGLPEDEDCMLPSVHGGGGASSCFGGWSGRHNLDGTFGRCYVWESSSVFGCTTVPASTTLRVVDVGATDHVVRHKQIPCTFLDAVVIFVPSTTVRDRHTAVEFALRSLVAVACADFLNSCYNCKSATSLVSTSGARTSGIVLAHESQPPWKRGAIPVLPPELRSQVQPKSNADPDRNQRRLNHTYSIFSRGNSPGAPSNF
ncbi:hypothetical protein GALMADRAFT_1341132 [Galerina marginata CBS 339.88]|uniref:Uncharacterized protein n=1 Tax=Galerina marginata (strain CBS 339.88) TaxID=685588 RepID=A0A067TZV7_GALM3|nr:hypothetical protein GALMADRAFT_1341132 [Galerina marginata CBS 339.88]